MNRIPPNSKYILRWRTLILVSVLVYSNMVFGQLPTDWTPSNKAGNIIIQSTQPANSIYDIDITRTSTSAGLKIFNENSAGRSLVLLGQGYGGKYGYLSHHSQSHVSDPGYKQTYRASSTVLTGADINGLGIVSSQDIRFNSGGAEDGKMRMIINSVGSVGIGTPQPLAKLHVAGSIYSGSTRTNSTFNGNLDAQSANFIGSEGYWAFRTSTNNAFNLDVYNSNSPIVALTALQNGNVGIGTTDPKGYKLAVAGKAIAEEVTVKLQANWPDYVFEPTYHLSPLDSIKTYIDKNKHLPEVPSAKEMEKNGVNLGEMNMLLLKKIEELTLYVIELNKRIDGQQTEIKELKNQLNK